MIAKHPIVVMLLILSPWVALALEPTPPEPEDLFRTDSVTELTLSPDRTFAVYCRRWVDPASREFRSALWRYDGKPDEPRPLEPAEPDAHHLLFSPDGKWVVFVSSRPFGDGTPAFRPVPPYSDPAGDIWFLPTSGGPAIPLYGNEKPYGRVITDYFYGNIAFSPNGQRLVFVADLAADPRTPQEISAGVQVVRPDQGEGYTGYGPTQIWVADLAEDPSQRAAAKVTRLTHDDFWYGDPQWLPDGRRLVVHSNRTSDRESVRYSINKDYNIYRLDASDGCLEPLTSGSGPEVSPRISPDGQRLLCLSVPRRGPHADVYNLLLVDLNNPQHSTRVLFDHHGPDAERPPHWPPNFPLPRDCWLDDERFYTTASWHLQSRRQVIDLRRGLEATDMSTVGAAETGARIRETPGRLSPPGKPADPPRLRGNDQIVHWKSTDGLEIDGILTVPPEGIAHKPYKMVVMPHGGPHSRAESGAGLITQVLACKGYAVFQPNFRGSSGYGVKFLDANRNDLGGGDMRDILSGIDYLVHEGLIDPRRQFVYGVSYGGYMTCWLVGQTNQFRAAVAQNAVTELNTMYLLSDLQSWIEWEIGGRPWEVPEAITKHSPLTYASAVRTPTLILHSANDRRCPLAMGQIFYHALERRGVKSQMVIYPDEGHPIRQPKHQVDVMHRVLNWFEAHDLK